MGVSVQRTVTAQAATYDLTTLAIVKDELNIASTDTGEDAWLSRGISQVSAVIAQACNRTFWPEMLTETQQIQQDPYPYQTPGGVAPLVLSRWPVISVVSVTQIWSIGTTPQTTVLTLNTDFSIDYEKGQLIRLNPFTGIAVTWESVPTVIVYIAGYGALNSQAVTIPATPYQVTVTNAATFSFDNGCTYAVGGAALTKITSGTPAIGQYLVSTSGQYTFAAAESGAAININYANGNIPLDLVDGTLRAITQRWWQADRDPMMMSIDQPNLGSKRYWIPTPGKGDNGSLPPEIQDIIARYRVPAIA